MLTVLFPTMLSPGNIVIVTEGNDVSVAYTVASSPLELVRIVLFTIPPATISLVVVTTLVKLTLVVKVCPDAVTTTGPS